MGWFIVSIVLPLMAPLLALLIFKSLPLPVPVQLMASLKDGQLCWGALGLCASGLYDIAALAPIEAPLRTPIVAWINGALIGILALSSIVATAGAVFYTPLPRPPGVQWHRHFKCFLMSVVLTVMAAMFYTIVHYGLFTLP